jgi:putative cardiolipin synthase
MSMVPARTAMRIDNGVVRSVVVRLLGLLLVALLAGCAGTLPPRGGQAVSTSLVAPPGTPLADIARRAGIDAATTGAWPMPESPFALDARLAAIEHATTSIDLQTYLVADDTTGKQVLRALRDAAARGVRVRFLVDDIYTAGLDRLLTGLASHANVEVRLFNPFVNSRGSEPGRLVALLADFDRLDHRMHNKLFVVDGALAVVGGRNLADEYFLRNPRGNFFDVDVLIVGALVPELAAWFDRYWNSEQAYDLRTIVAATHSVQDEAADLGSDFERVTRPASAPPAPPAADEFGAPPLRVQLATGDFRLLHVAAASVHADPPEKAAPGVPHEMQETLAHRFLYRLEQVQHEVLIFSPYFVPDEKTRATLRGLRARNVSVHVITNSLAVSDQPITVIGLERHQRELLAEGVELYELSTERMKLDSHLSTLLGSSIGRLHAKLFLVDRRIVYVGSLNVDGRSAHINTEIGVRLESPELAAMLRAAFRIEEAVGVVRVRLAEDGRSLSWSVLDADGREQILDHEPDGSWWHRLRVRLLGLLVPEGEL